MMDRQANRGKRHDCRDLVLDSNTFAIVFDMDPHGSVERIESFMPPFEGLAPHVYLFVSQLAMMSRDPSFVRDLLSQAFEQKIAGISQPPVPIHGTNDQKEGYMALHLGDHQIALILEANRDKDGIRRAWMAIPSFSLDNLASYLYVEYLCQRCLDEKFFQKMVVDGFNRNLFVTGAEQQIPKYRNYSYPLTVGENQAALIFVQDGQTDRIGHVVVISPRQLPRLSDASVMIRSLSVLSSQEYFFHKVLFHGFQQLTKGRPLAMGQVAAGRGQGQTIMLSGRQAALLCSVDFKQDRLAGVVPVLPGIESRSLRSSLFVYALADLINTHLGDSRQRHSASPLGLALMSGSH